MPRHALLIVDVQNDFCPGGALEVPHGDEVVAVLNRCIKIFQDKNLPIFASRDWHPHNTIHFRDFGGLWPVHCVQGSEGAKFHPGLKLPSATIVLSKGFEPSQDSYSAFQGYNGNNDRLDKILKNEKVTDLFIGGLATDYCVKATVLDALREGFKTYLLTEACRGVDLNKDDSKLSIEEMVSEGAQIVLADQIAKII